VYLAAGSAFLATMEPVRDKSSFALLIFLVAWATLLWSALTSVPARAEVGSTPTCFGRPAAITASGLTLVTGSRFSDVIVVTGGANVDAGAGPDFVCGGPHIDRCFEIECAISC
jgi:hypothetical protein